MLELTKQFYMEVRMCQSDCDGLIVDEAKRQDAVPGTTATGGSPELDALVEMAQQLPPMTDQQKREQAESFARGNVALDRDPDARHTIPVRPMPQTFGC
jgi:hypothetical protein